MKNVPNRVAITGSEGFIGSNLSLSLESLGYKILRIDTHLSEVNPTPVDLLDRRLLFQALDDFQPNWILHLAAQTDVRFSNINPHKDATVNIIGTINLVDWFEKSDSQSLIYFNSGGAIYDLKQVETPDETSPIGPLSQYGISKFAAEMYVLRLLGQTSKNILSLRLSNVYGKGQTAGVIPIFIKSIIDSSSVKIFGDGTSSRDFIHVQDVIDFVVLSMENEYSGIYNIASGVSTSLNQLLIYLTTGLGIIEKVHEKEKLFEIKHSKLDITKARNVGWFPRRDLKTELLNLRDVAEVNLKLNTRRT